MTDYREVKCIELHELNIALTTEAEKGNCFVGRYNDPPYDRSAFSINLCDIGMLAEMLGVEISKNIDVPKLSNQSMCKTGVKQQIDVIEIPIYKTCPNYEGKITKIECQVVNSGLVNIKTTSNYDDEGDPGVYIEEITYSGSFTIWWSQQPLAQ
jgi:hypothetical protein